MMAIGTILLSIPGNFDNANPPRLGFFNSKPRLLFDATVDKIVHWTFRMPSNYASAPVLKLQYSMASATVNEVIMACQVMAVSDGDAQAIDPDSYDTVNTSSATTVPATAGYLDEISLALANNDLLVAGDWVALKVSRDADNVGDDATGDLELVAATLEYTTT